MAEQYSLPDVLSKMYENQLAIEAALIELVLLEEGRGSSEACENARAALGHLSHILHPSSSSAEIVM